MVNRADRPDEIASLFPDISIGEAGVRASYNPHVEHEGQPGWVQGGFVATVLDYVCASAATTAFGAQAITGNLAIRYGLPVLLEGGPYLVEAAIVGRPVDFARLAVGRTVRVAGAVVAPGGERVVTASGLFIRRCVAT